MIFLMSIVNMLRDSTMFILLFDLSAAWYLINVSKKNPPAALSNRQGDEFRCKPINYRP